MYEISAQSKMNILAAMKTLRFFALLELTDYSRPVIFSLKYCICCGIVKIAATFINVVWSVAR
jgi:hypothetical protein